MASHRHLRSLSLVGPLIRVPIGPAPARSTGTTLAGLGGAAPVGALGFVAVAGTSSSGGGSTDPAVSP